jgi:hypothetical protein
MRTYFLSVTRARGEPVDEPDFTDIVCYNCGLTGHLRAACPSRNQQKSRWGGRQAPPAPQEEIPRESWIPPAFDRARRAPDPPNAEYIAAKEAAGFAHHDPQIMQALLMTTCPHCDAGPLSGCRNRALGRHVPFHEMRYLRILAPLPEGSDPRRALAAQQVAASRAERLAEITSPGAPGC